MGNTAFDNAGGPYYTFATGANVQPTYPYSGPPVAIPDNIPVGGVGTIIVADSKTDPGRERHDQLLTHTYVGDLILSPHSAGRRPTSRCPQARLPSGEQLHEHRLRRLPRRRRSPPERPRSPARSARRRRCRRPTASTPRGPGRSRSSTRPDRLGTIDNLDPDHDLSRPRPADRTRSYKVNSLVADNCAAGGRATPTAYWDAGEQVQFKVTVNNDGTAPLTGVTATVVLDDPRGRDDRRHGDLSRTSRRAARRTRTRRTSPSSLPTSLACGCPVAFEVTITTDQGSWGGRLQPRDRRPGRSRRRHGAQRDLRRRHSRRRGPSWTAASAAAPCDDVDDGQPRWRGRSRPRWSRRSPSWTATTPETAIGVLQDEQLITPVMNLSTRTSVTLQFDQYFRWFNRAAPRSPTWTSARR